MSSKKPQHAAFLFRDPTAARALPILPPTGKPSGTMTRARKKSGAVRRCEPSEPAGGLTLKHLEQGGVEECDLAAIRDACLERVRKERGP